MHRVAACFGVAGILAVTSIAAMATSCVDDFNPDPLGAGSYADVVTTSECGGGFTYTFTNAGDGPHSGGGFGINTSPGNYALEPYSGAYDVGTTEVLTIEQTNGKAFVFNSAYFDLNSATGGTGFTIKGIGPEPFTADTGAPGTSGTYGPTGPKLVTEVEIRSVDFYQDWIDDVDVEIDIPGAAVYGSNLLITNGDSSASATDGTDLGLTDVAVTQDFELRSIGEQALAVSGDVTVTGAGFSITQQPSSPIASGSDSTFTVQFDPQGPGEVTGVVTIVNNSEASPYTFEVTAEGDADTTKPDVTIDQAGGQADPANGSPLNFTVIFSEAVTGFATGDVTLVGTAGATTGTVTEIAPNDGTTYNVAVSGMTSDGTVTATIAAGVAQDGASNTSNASTSTDNTVTYDATAPTDPTPSSSSHTVSVWDNDNTVDIQIAGASDALSGVDGFEYEWDQSATWTPTEAKEQEEFWVGTTFTATSDGDWYFHIATVDNAGNWTSTEHLGPFRIDTQAPPAPASDGTRMPSNGTVTNDNTPTFSWSAPTDPGGSGIQNYVIQVIDSSLNVDIGILVADTTYTASQLDDDDYTWKLYARDLAGNIGSWGTEWALTVDTVSPTVAISDDEPGTASIASGDVTVTFTFNEKTYGFVVGDVTVVNGTKAGTFASGSDGAYVFTLVVTPDSNFEGNMTVDVAAGVATDYAGNPNTAAMQSVQPVDTLAPSGYTGTLNDDPVNSANQTSTSFSFADAEVGATYSYDIKDGGSGKVSGSGTITSAAQSISSIDVSSLADGTLTLSVTLTDATGNGGAAATDTVTKDATAPSGYSVTFDHNPVGGGNENATSFTFASAEVGASYSYTISDGANPDVTGNGGPIATSSDQITGIDVSGLDDGTLTLSATLTDAAGNTGGAATDTATKDTVGSTVAISDDEPGTASIASGDVTYTFSFTEKTYGFVVGDVTVVNGTKAGTFASGSDGAYAFTLVVTPDANFEGNMTVDVAAGVATDYAGNPNTAATQSVQPVDTLAPSVTGVTVSDHLIDDRDVGAATYSITVSYSEAMTTNGSADPVLSFTPGLGTTLSAPSGSWVSSTTYEIVYDVLDANVAELGIDIGITGGADAFGNEQVASNEADRFDVDTLNPPPGAVSDIAIEPMGSAGPEAFLDRGLDLAEDEELPMIGEFPLTAIYEVGEFVTGACNVCSPSGGTVRGSFVHLYIYSVDVNVRPEGRVLLDHWSVHYDSDTGCYSFSWDTTDWEPGYYDIHFFFADWTTHTCRVQLIAPVEE